MKKRIFTLLLATLFFGALQANPVDVATAKSLGVKFMKANTAIKAETAELTYTAYAENGQAAFYVFALRPKGFVIVSADDRAKPILGYSTESNFTAQLPDGLMTFFENYKAGFSQMFANNDERTAEAVTDWTSLAETGMLSSRKANRSVEPLLASIWNQTDLYNNMAPEDPNSVYSGHCKSGCVANTMSQIMRYWEWPRSGEGSHGYDADGNYGSYGWQEADFSAATYRYELMPDYLDFASPQDEVDATALLEYHAGVSVNMGYGPNASGAYSQDVGPAMESYFRFSSDYWHNYQEYSDSWEEDMVNNLDAGMPLYYASQGDVGGHAYVVDGYDDWYFFHVNWGWGGFDNGYYAIDGFYLTFYSFPYWHNAVFNLHPVDEYYDAPKAVENLEVTADAMNVTLTFNPVFETRGGEATRIDAVCIMRDGVLIDVLMNVTEPQVTYQDEVEKNGTYYYTVYAGNQVGMSKVARDTVMVGNTCDVRFELADSGNNGWDLSSIAVLDEDGKVSQRVGLWDGGSATVIAQLPSDQTVTFFWTYDNTCYSHGSLSEVSYEIYDWNDNLIAASYDYPTVGEITDYEMNCDPDDVAELKQTQVLYPNPATDRFIVEGHVKEVKVFNTLGQLMHQGTENTVEVSAWPEGLYFVRIVDENDAVTTVKLIKQN
ncbi:MAG: thiol protease/hemagglutinin PrtT [Bacteroidales bacterium]|nr:thiol protease/hemagglutinin PrtT [Bacteroidales bacterium]